MSGFALRALVLITCDARRGEWVSLRCLAERLAAPAHAVQAAAAWLVEQHMVLHATHAGQPYWGVGTEGLLPAAPNSIPQQSTTENP